MEIRTMTRVDFYLLPNVIGNELLYSCRLIEKAYLHNHQIFVYVSDKPMAQKLDDLLWAFHDISFIPHQIYAPTAIEVPVIISDEKPDKIFCDVLLNLTE